MTVDRADDDGRRRATVVVELPPAFCSECSSSGVVDSGDGELKIVMKAFSVNNPAVRVRRLPRGS